MRLSQSVLVLTILIGSGNLLPGQDASLEDRVKATFIFNFIQYAQWPRTTISSSPSFPICIVGDSVQPLIEETVRGERVSGLPITVRELTQARDASGCRVIYFRSSANRATALETLNTAKTSPVLTVGETADFLANGGIVRFTKVRNRIHFEINPGAAEKVSLSISSRLLRLADIVRSP